jgi:hypothetical protein
MSAPEGKATSPEESGMHSSAARHEVNVAGVWKKLENKNRKSKNWKFRRWQRLNLLYGYVSSANIIKQANLVALLVGVQHCRAPPWQTSAKKRAERKPAAS